jgi:hypothetical protein
MTTTLYEPPRKPLVGKRLVVVVLVVLAVGGIGASLYRRQPGWFTKAATSILGLVGYELVSVDVATTPRQTNILLDGERVTELPLHVRRDGASHRVSAIAPGFEPVEVTFRANGDQHLILTLKPAKRR